MPENTVFFNEQSEQSAIKAKIVSDYFAAWSRVMKNNWPGNLSYIDLFCGPGKYGNGALSAPLLVVQKILNDDVLSKRMSCIFNDADSNNIELLKRSVSDMDAAGVLKKHIGYYNYTIESGFEQNVRIPTGVPVLSFVDPFGYKGLTINLIEKLIANSGSDCIFFFNYNRINMALSSNTKFDEHLQGLFGAKGLQKLKEELAPLTSAQREPWVINRLQEVLTENKANYVLPFKFYGNQQKRTSHFIVFVTKHPTACKIMKQIMYSNSAKDADGVATFSFEDSHNFGNKFEQISLFQRPLLDLQDELQQIYAGQKACVKELCEKYDTDFTNYYVAKNVKEALRHLENEGKIIVISGRKQKMRNGVLNMPDAAIIQF